MSIPIPEIDAIVHFPFGIRVVELSTENDELVLVIADPYENCRTIHHQGQTVITIRKKEQHER